MKFLTKEEVAKFFRVHPRTVARWLKSGLLIGYKLGGGKTALWRIPSEEVEIFLKKSRNKKTK
jgi:excisionase family DNA binding protein